MILYDHHIRSLHKDKDNIEIKIYKLKTKKKKQNIISKKIKAKAKGTDRSGNRRSQKAIRGPLKTHCKNPSR